MAEKDFKYRLLVVDDDAAVRETTALLLTNEGYDVRTSEDGFSALVKLRTALPDLIITDMRMPNMSGFELLSIVRRRFPQIAVIAISGEYEVAGPVGLLADVFLQKGSYRPPQLFMNVKTLLEASPIRSSVLKANTAPVWTPVNEQGYSVITCPECLRSCSVPQPEESGELCHAECLHCGSDVKFLRDLKAKKR